MALTQYESQLEGYMAAEVNDNIFVNNPQMPIIKSDADASFSQGNLWKTRHLVEDTSTWQIPTANTDAGLSAYSSDAQYLPVLRRGHFLKLGDAEALRDGASNVLENTGILFARHFASNFENVLFNRVIPSVMSGCASGTHWNNMSSSAFDWDYVMQKIYTTENASSIKYVFMHPDVANGVSLWNTLDTPSTTQTTPIKPFGGAKLVGQKNGLYIFVSSLLHKTGTVYQTVAMGDGAILFDYQSKDYGVKIFEDQRHEMGATISKYLASFSVGINGISYGGSPTALGGASDAEIGTASNWSKLTNIRSNQIPVVAVDSLAS